MRGAGAGLSGTQGLSLSSEAVPVLGAQEMLFVHLHDWPCPPPRLALSPPPSNPPFLFHISGFSSLFATLQLQTIYHPSLSPCPGAVSFQPNVLRMDVERQDVKIQLTFKSPFCSVPNGGLLLLLSGRALCLSGQHPGMGARGVTTPTNWPL